MGTIESEKTIHVWNAELPLFESGSDIKWAEMCIRSREEHPENYPNEDIPAVIAQQKELIKRLKTEETIMKIVKSEFSKEESHYCMTCYELNTLYRKFKGKPFEIALAAFRYGFFKGRRCEKAAQKRKKKTA